MKTFLFVDFKIHYLFNKIEYPTGGATVQAFAWIEGLKKIGQKISVLVDDTQVTIKDENIKFLNTFQDNRNDKKIKWLYQKYPILKKAINDSNPDYVYQAGAGFITYVLVHICTKFSIPFIHRIANDVDVDKRIRKRLPFLQCFFYNRALIKANYILCQNDYQYRCIKKRFPKKKILKIHNPIIFDQDPHQYKTFKQRKYFAWLGIFQHQKNLPYLLQIIKKFPDVAFYLGGTPAKNIDDETSSAILSLEKCDNVNFSGYVGRDKINEFLGNAYALINTSHYEGFSNTFLEAFKVGTPVITTRNVDPDGIIKKYELGLVGEKYDDLSNLLNKIMTNKKYDTYIENCLQYVRNNHDTENLSRSLLDFLEN